MEGRTMSKHATSTTELKSAFTMQPSGLANAEETRVFKKLKLRLSDIRKNNKLMGFTLKNSTQALADVDKPEELTELALLSNQIFCTSAKLLNACNQAAMKSAILEGSKMRILCLSVSGNQLTMFMEKTVNTDRILEKLVEADI
jgi:hypothetical protein